MAKALKKIFDWVSAHPHSLVCVFLGLLGGVLIRFPGGWVLPDPTASLIGAFAGAGAAVGGALWAANAKQRQEDARVAIRAEAHAAYIFNEIAIVYGFIPEIQSRCSAFTADKGMHELRGLAYELHEHADSWSDAIKSVRPESVAALPDACVAATAGAMSAAQFASRLANSIYYNFKDTPESVNNQKAVAATVETHCVQIQHNFQPYLAYCRETFGVIL
ncbi:hypothetical protein GCM10007862_07320 [Dyella lipolytica]|uniref:Uncharacterized protein n=1 Tax=Dyella lipolytica TaxID=1867835 RepID=A0ABW8J0G2_9GAMM|nr:hypothetical protein [Dyella lipolytica]GLQ45681.1 hypothetical protein GCM10007862_07320 [Dyella lipolytica]